jgi:hypothetical protein
MISPDKSCVICTSDVGSTVVNCVLIFSFPLESVNCWFVTTYPTGFEEGSVVGTFTGEFALEGGVGGFEGGFGGFEGGFGEFALEGGFGGFSLEGGFWVFVFEGVDDIIYIHTII